VNLLRRRNVRVSCTQQSHFSTGFGRWSEGRSTSTSALNDDASMTLISLYIHPDQKPVQIGKRELWVPTPSAPPIHWATLSHIVHYKSFVFGESSRLRLEDFVGFKCVLCQLMRPRQSLLNHHLLQTAEKVEEEEQNIFPPSRWTSNHMNRWNLLILTQIHWKSTLLDCFVHGGPGELLVVFSCFTMCVGRLF
jgi:hypothetical protein